MQIKTSGTRESDSVVLFGNVETDLSWNETTKKIALKEIFTKYKDAHDFTGNFRKYLKEILKIKKTSSQISTTYGEQWTFVLGFDQHEIKNNEKRFIVNYDDFKYFENNSPEINLKKASKIFKDFSNKKYLATATKKDL